MTRSTRCCFGEHTLCSGRYQTSYCDNIEQTWACDCPCHLEAVPLVASPAPASDVSLRKLAENVAANCYPGAFVAPYTEARALALAVLSLQTRLRAALLVARPVSLGAPPQELIDRATEWLTKGGFFNAEVMAACHPNETSQLVIDMRDALKAAPPALVAPAQESSHSVGTGASVTIAHTAAPHVLAAPLDKGDWIDHARAKKYDAARFAAAPPREDDHPYALGTLARALHDIETRDVVITSLEAEIARLAAPPQDKTWRLVGALQAYVAFLPSFDVAVTDVDTPAIERDRQSEILFRLKEIEERLRAAPPPREDDSQLELVAAYALIAKQHEELRCWLTANAPGGWIDDIRQRAHLAALEHPEVP